MDYLITNLDTDTAVPEHSNISVDEYIYST